MSLIEEQHLGYYLGQMRSYREIKLKVFLFGIIDDGLDKISKAVTLREKILKKNQPKSQQPQS